MQALIGKTPAAAVTATAIRMDCLNMPVRRRDTGPGSALSPLFPLGGIRRRAVHQNEGRTTGRDGHP